MKRIYMVVVAALFLWGACQQSSSNKQDATSAAKTVTFERDSLVLKDSIMTPELLWNLGRVSGGDISPDGKYAIYGVSYYSVKQNKGNRDLYLYDLVEKKSIQITNTPTSEWSESWSPDGKKILFMAVSNGKAMLHEMDTDGKNKRAIAGTEGVENYRLGHNGGKILYTKDVKVLQTAVDKHKDLPKTSAKIIDDLMFRHWDHWTDDKFSHVFVGDFDAVKGEVVNATDIMPNERWDAPLKPWGGIEEVVFSPNDDEIAYTCKKKYGKDYALSTNSDIFVYSLKTETTINISEGHVGYDKAPVYSPDGKHIAWTSMKRDGFEADQDRIYVYDRKAKTIRNYSKSFDQSAGGLTWSANSKKIYFTSAINATYQIFSLELASGKFRQITKGTHNFNSFHLGTDYMVASRMSMSAPAALYRVELKDGSFEQMTDHNAATLGKLKMGKVEERWITTTDNKKMLTWVIYPPNFDPNKKYPTLLYCQGGPQSAVSQFWSFRWNFQMMAANDYIIVAPNRRGLPSFGQEWNDQISKDYGGQNIQDYFSAIDELAKEPFVDENRLGAVGASYGGYSVFHLAGIHNGRFKSFIAHAGIFNFEAMYGSTEELFFVDWEMGGPYWNKQAKNSYAASPHRFVDKWDTPIFIIHGELDYRIPVTQAMNAFTVAKMKELKSRFLYFPDENHWILKPQNGVLWQREFFKWLKETL